MNIKNVISTPILPIDSTKRIEGGVRTQKSTDRDANGQQQGQEQEKKEHLNQQEFDDALQALESHPGLKANNLTVQVNNLDGVRVILVLDPEGNTVRRLSEGQLWLATRDKDRQTGRILDKAM